MKTISWSTLLIIAFLSLACSQPDSEQDKSKISEYKLPKIMYKAQFNYTIFQTLKTNNFKVYSKFFITSADLDYFFLKKLSSRLKRIKNPERIKRLKLEISTARKNFPDRRRARLLTLHNSFLQIRNQAIQKGVDWKTAEFKGYKLENARHVHKVATADMIITFVSNKKHYVIKVPRSQFVRRGWIYSEPLRWVGLYK